MSTTSVTIKLNRFPELMRDIPNAIDRVVETQAHALEADIKSGIVEKNIVDTGAYLGSWNTEREDEHTFVVFSDKEYGPYQEYGTARGLPARPHVVPAAVAIESDLNDEIRRVLDNG